MDNRHKEAISQDTLDRISAGLNHAFKDHVGVPRAYILVVPSENATQWTTNIKPEIAEGVIAELSKRAHEVSEEDESRPFVKVYPPIEGEAKGNWSSNMGESEAMTALVNTIEGAGIMILDKGGEKAVEKLQAAHVKDLEKWNAVLQGSMRKTDKALKVINDLSKQLVDTYAVLHSLLQRPGIDNKMKKAIRTQMGELELNLEGAKTMIACYDKTNQSAH